MYNAFKILAAVSLVMHIILHFITVTDFFNRAFIAIALLVLIMPRKWWPLYVLPVLLLLAGLIVGGYVLYLRIIVG
jgi:endonuclease/exonuclease/phosphatase (EEP) superfamily protein YafD